MTPEQEQNRMDRIHSIGEEIRRLMHDYPHGDDYAIAHLDRARAHIDEAWIAANGQKARTVESLTADIEAAHRIFNAVIKANDGARIVINDRVFIKQPTQTFLEIAR